MELNPRVQIIPANPKQRDKRVAYARVSSNTCLLVDTYIDIASSKTGSNRKEFNRMFADRSVKKIDIVLTKSISRFGRDSLQIFSALEQLRKTNTRVIFGTEEIDTEKTDNRLMISVIESFVQAENES